MFSDGEIAMMAYELNRGYNHVIGDPWTDPPWSGIPQWYRDALCDGVRAVRSGMTRRQLHENWCWYYRALGWVWGPSKDAMADPPTHPCLVRYEDLSPEQRRKTAIFRDAVLMLLRI